MLDKMIGEIVDVLLLKFHSLPVEERPAFNDALERAVKRIDEEVVKPLLESHKTN